MSNAKHVTWVLCVVGAGWLISGCSRAPHSTPLSADVMAVVAGQAITRKAFDEQLARRGAAAARPEVRAAVLAEMVQREAAAAKARTAGYDLRPELQAQFRKLLADSFQQEELARRAPGQPNDADIERYYQTHLDRFATPERVRGAIIFLKVPARAGQDQQAAARDRAETVRQAALKLSPNEPAFGLVAQQFSEDQATRYRGGDLGYLTRAELIARLGEGAADALLTMGQPGTTSVFTEGQGGLYLLKLEGRQPGSQRALAEVREGIVYLLRREQQAEAELAFRATCTNGLAIRINRELLDSLPANEAMEEPPAVPVTQTALAK